VEYMEEKNGDGVIEKEKDNNRSTRADCTRSAIEDKQNAPESQSRIAVPAKTSDPTKSPQDIAFDASQGVIYKSRSEESDVRSTRAERSEEISKNDNSLIRLK
jgi:hypothetical protein